MLDPYEAVKPLEAAFAWKKAGWDSPIPVGYVNKDMAREEGIPRGWHKQRKNNPPPGVTGWNAAPVTSQDVGAWVTDPALDGVNMALYLHANMSVIGVDLDRDGAKEEIEERAGAKFPATWSVTSRGPNQPRRVLLYQAVLPSGRVWMDHPAPQVDAIHPGHRYVVAPGSIHPSGARYELYDDEGELYEGVIGPERLAELPGRLIEAISREGQRLEGSAANDEEVSSALNAFRLGDMCKPVKRQLERERERYGAAVKASGIHDPGQMFALVALGFEGHKGVSMALGEHLEIHMAARKERDGHTGAAEWWRMLNGAVGKLLMKREGEIATTCDCDGDGFDDLGFEIDVKEPTSEGKELDGPVPGPNLPDSFWESRPVLKHIRQAAHYRATSADVALHVVLARLAATSHHTVHIENSLGYASLNFFSILLGDSGTGKSRGKRAAKELLPVPIELDDEKFRDGVGIGSGEGIAEMYMGMVEKDKEEGDKKKKVKVREQVRHNAFIYVDEGEVLAKQLQRQGATIGPVLRSAWLGEVLGQQNGTAETTRIIKEGAYMLGLVMGFQMNTVESLMADAEAGTPQRFLWCSSVDPSIPDEPGDDPGQLGHLVPNDDLFDDATDYLVTFPEEINTQLRREVVAKAKGTLTTERIDSHRQLMLTKIAALLALLDGRKVVDMDDWKLAMQMWATSSAVMAQAREASQNRAQEARKAAAQRQVAIERLKSAEAGNREAKIRLKIVEKLDGGALKRAELVGKFMGASRPEVRPVIDAMVQDGELKLEDGLLSVAK